MSLTIPLAQIHRVTTRVAGRERDVFIFDHHRGAFTLWSLAAQELGAPLTLVTLDRHMDLERPTAPVPPRSTEPVALDTWARFSLSARNDDHVLAAMEAGAIGEAAIIARSHEPPSLASLRPYRDSAGRPHACAFARTLDSAGEDVMALVRRASDIALDLDLDCFTTLSDGHLDEVLAWDVEQIDAFLRPPDSEALWTEILQRTRIVTIAREPFHCGGFERQAKLWLGFSEVFFRRVLGVPPP